MQSCGNKAHAILKQLSLNAPDCQICITESDCGSFKTVHKPVGSNILSVTLAQNPWQRSLHALRKSDHLVAQHCVAHSWKNSL